MEQAMDGQAPEGQALQVLVRDGEVLASPLPVSRDAAGAALLAEVYAYPTGRPWVRAMMNTTIDGAISGHDGTSGSLRNPDDSFVFGVLRALTDVVLVGAGTVRAEDYRRPRGRADLLEPSRRPAGGTRPALAIRTRTGGLPASVEADWPTFLLSPSAQRAEVIARSGLPAAHVLAAETEQAAVQVLIERGYRGIQAEGGPSSLGALVAAGTVDELCFSLTHRTVGGPSSRVLVGPAHVQDWELTHLIVGAHATLTTYRRPR